MDEFDALRDADLERRRWIAVAREFQMAVERVVEDVTVAHLERCWAELVARPLAKAEDGRRLVSEALDEIALEQPMTLKEMAESEGEFTVLDVAQAQRDYRRLREAREEQIEEAFAQMFTSLRS